MFDLETYIGGAPCIQALADGRCILTFDLIRGVVLPSLDEAIAWCTVQLKNETLGTQTKKVLEHLLIDANPARSGPEAQLQADLIIALLDAWARCARCQLSRECRKCPKGTPHLH